MSNNNTNSNKINVPEARAAMEQFKFEVAKRNRRTPEKGLQRRPDICTEWLCRRLYGKKDD